jgi:hypothetical protein
MNLGESAVTDQLAFVTIDATETGIRLRIDAVRAVEGAAPVGFVGLLEGPSCKFARTLSTSYKVSRPLGGADSGSVLAESYVADPCYWTPALPFLYRLVGEVARADGTTLPLDRLIGFRRLRPERASLRLEGERVVFRGAVVASLGVDGLDDARNAGTVLIIGKSGEELCHAADRTGVGLIADFRNESSPLDATLRRLAWHPSVMAVILDAEATSAGREAGLLVANGVRAAADPSPTDLRFAPNLFVVELSPGERPPAWVASSRRPVIAVRRGAAYADLQSARAGCDQLQADLAPEFNLAGYFVSRE